MKSYGSAPTFLAQTGYEQISREVAEQTGAPTGTVKARLARGRSALAPYLAVASEGGIGA